MNEHEKHLSDLKEIRSLMEKSSRFLSLSGLSGVVAGLFALIGAYAAYKFMGDTFYFSDDYYYLIEGNSSFRYDFITFIVADAAIVLVCALCFGFYFTWRKAQAAGHKIWNKTTIRLFTQLMIPLSTGGILCLILIYQGFVGIVPALTLIFYGLGIINAAHVILHDVRLLGYSEIILGLIAVFFIGYGLFFWTIGFGLLHIIYGTVMYFKHDRQK